MSDTVPVRPLPVVDADSRYFWERAHEHELWIQTCLACGKAVFYPRQICPHCWGELKWQRATGQGTVHSFTIVHRPPSPAFAADVPYVVGLVDLEEGCRIMARLGGQAVDAWCIGQTVAVTFDDVSPEISLPAFRPQGSARGA